MSLRILLADENLAVQKLVELTLGKEGMEVTATDNGLSALDLALKRTPDLVLADFNLEGLDIFSFIKKFKNQDRLSDVPIILLINATQHYDPNQFQPGEVAAFFKKPIDAQELLEEVKKRVESSENPLVDLDPPPHEEPSVIAEYFSDSESDAEKVESLLGWSSSESSSDTVSETMEEKTIVSPLRTGDSNEEDDLGRQPFQSFPLDAPAETPTTQEGVAADQEEDLSRFPFSSTEDPLNELSEASTASLDSEEEQTVLSSPDSNDIAQNLNETNSEEAGPLQAASEDEQPSEEVSREEVEESAPPCLPPVEEGASSKAEQTASTQTMGQRVRLLPDEAMKQNIQESVEKVVWEVLPEILRTTLSKEVIASIVEKVVWEVVVPLAESEIKKEIRRLQAEVP